MAYEEKLSLNLPLFKRNLLLFLNDNDKYFNIKIIIKIEKCLSEIYRSLLNLFISIDD